MNIETASPESPDAQPAKRFDWLHVTLLILLAIIVTAAVSVWLVRSYLFPSEFKPVQLSVTEEQVLDAKLERLEGFGTAGTPPVETLPEGRLEPERYSEAGADRSVYLSEREVNSLVARNPDMARRLALDLSDNLVSAKLLVPVDEDFPILSGKILKVRAGVELAFDQGKPVVKLRGLSVMGVPVPNAWLGGLKNIDLVREFGQQPGFWQSFAAGVESLKVEDGALHLQLRE
jgi:hypothetical protein